MKKTSKILALGLCLVLCMSVMAFTALAAEAEQDGLKLTLTTDKAEYAAGDQIIANLKVENTSAAPITNILAKIEAPASLKIAAGAAQKNIATLAAGASENLEVTYQTEAPKPVDPPVDPDVPEHGDTTVLMVVCAAVICCAVIALLLVNRKAACMVLALVLVAGICVPAVAATEVKSMEVSTSVKVGDEKITLKALVSFEIEIEEEIIPEGPIIRADVNPDHFDMSGVTAADPVLKSNGAVNSFAAFHGPASQYYVASATVKITNPDGGDTWSRVGISHWNGSNSYYGFQVSPGPNFDARKAITMVITDGNVQWGTVTDRSQNWWQNDQAALDYNNIQLTTVRYGNTYYAFLNGKLWYVDYGIEGFDNVDTIPVLNLGSCEAAYSNLSVQYGKSKVEAFLDTADSTKFYAADPDKTILGTDGSIQFIGAADNSCVLNAKDHAAKSNGLAAMLPADVESKISFDLKLDYFGGRDGLPALAVTLNRYDRESWEARSLVIGQYKAGWTGWNSNGNLNEGIGDGGHNYALNGEETRLEEGQTYHVELVRFISGTGMDTRMVITDAEGNVLLEHTWGWANDGYQGRAKISFLCRDVDCTISNLTIG